MSHQRYVLNDQWLTIIVSTALTLTVDGVSNPRPLAEPSCLCTGIDPEMGTEIEGPGGLYASVAKVGASSTPTETILSGEVLIMNKSTKLFQ